LALAADLEANRPVSVDTELVSGVMSPPRLREQARWMILGVAGVVLLWHSLLYNFVTDDAYISFVYSRNFADHGELAFNLGDPVEGYTNFSWTVLLGVIMKLGITPEVSSRVLGTVCALGSLAVAMKTMERALGNRSLWTVVPSVLLACSSGFACWTSGGLETQLFTLLFIGALDAVVAAVADPRALRRAAICLALAAMTRPEGPLIAAVLGGVWLLHRYLLRRRGAAVPVAIARGPLDARLVRAISIVAALVFLGMLVGGLGLIAGFGTLSTVIGTPMALFAVLAFVAVPVVGLYDCVRAGSPRTVLQLGVALLVVGGLVMLGAIRSSTGTALDDVVTWNRAVPLALLAITAGAAALGLAFTVSQELRPGVRAHHELVAAAWFVGLWAPWFLWRWWYYGWPFPNTYYVKAAGPWTNPEFGSQMLGHGFHYVWVWLVQTKLLYAAPIALLGLAAITPRSSRFVLALSSGLLLAVYLAYTITVGGDFMGLHRFILPLFVLAAFAVVLGLEWLARVLPEERVVFPGSLSSLAAMIGVGIGVVLYGVVFASELRLELRSVVPALLVVAAALVLVILRGTRRGLSAATGLLVIGVFATTQAELTTRSLDPKNLTADRGVIDTPAFLIVYTEDRAKIGAAMAPCFTDDDFSIVGGAGAQPYFGKMRAIDVFGLVSDKIAHREPRSRPRSGHTKWGNDALLAEYDPDFIFSCYRIHATPQQPRLPCAGPWLARGFEHVTLQIPGMQEQGEYYTFLAKKSRAFSCANRVR